MAQLIVRETGDSDGEIREVELAAGEFIIGRLSGVDLELENQTISRRHASLVSTTQGFILTDLGSANGTWVNGKRITRHLLRHGDKILFGTAAAIFYEPSDSRATMMVDVKKLLDEAQGTKETEGTQAVQISEPEKFEMPPLKLSIKDPPPMIPASEILPEPSEDPDEPVAEVSEEPSVELPPVEDQPDAEPSTDEHQAEGASQPGPEESEELPPAIASTRRPTAAISSVGQQQLEPEPPVPGSQSAPQPVVMPDPPEFEPSPTGSSARRQSSGGFWIRVVATLIDFILLGIIVGGLSAGIAFLSPRFASQIPALQNYQIPASAAISFLIPVLYLLLSWTRSGQTLGKKLCKLRVVHENGKLLNLSGAIVRLIGYFLSSLFIGIGYLMVAFTDQKRGLHDMIAHSLVVRDR